MSTVVDEKLPRFRSDTEDCLYRRRPLLPPCSQCPLLESVAVKSGATLYSLCRSFREDNKDCRFAHSTYWKTWTDTKKLKPQVDEGLLSEFCESTALLRYFDLIVAAKGPVAKDGKPTQAFTERQKLAKHVLSMAKSIGVAKSSGTREQKRRFNPDLLDDDE